MNKILLFIVKKPSSWLAEGGWFYPAAVYGIKIVVMEIPGVFLHHEISLLFVSCRADICNRRCALGEVCLSNEGCVRESNLVKCGLWRYCKKGQDCCGNICMPEGNVCCSSYHCETGQTCCGIFHCCQNGVLIITTRKTTTPKYAARFTSPTSDEPPYSTDSNSFTFPLWGYPAIIVVIVFVLGLFCTWGRRKSASQKESTGGQVIAQAGPPQPSQTFETDHAVNPNFINLTYTTPTEEAPPPSYTTATASTGGQVIAQAGPPQPSQTVETDHAVNPNFINLTYTAPTEEAPPPSYAIATASTGGQVIAQAGPPQPSQTFETDHAVNPNFINLTYTAPTEEAPPPSYTIATASTGGQVIAQAGPPQPSLTFETDHAVNPNFINLTYTPPTEEAPPPSYTIATASTGGQVIAQAGPPQPSQTFETDHAVNPNFINLTYTAPTEEARPPSYTTATASTGGQVIAQAGPPQPSQTFETDHAVNPNFINLTYTAPTEEAPPPSYTIATGVVNFEAT